MASEESWKDKYLRELDEAEQREKQWLAERNVLERMLVRTSLASEGQTPELDNLLNRLRSDLRKQKFDIDAWKTLQDQIDKAITRLDEAEPKGPKADTPAVAPAEPRGSEHDIAEEGHRLRIARRVGQLLGLLLNQVSLEPEVESQARTLQQTLLSSNDWEVFGKA